MGQKKGTDDRDAIAQLADIGENTLRRLVALPRRLVVGTFHRVEARLHDGATRLRAIDPLDSRVAALEKRLDSLEKPEKATARKPSTPATPSTPRTARTAAETKPGQAEHGHGPRSDAVTEGALEGDQAQAVGERRAAE